MTDRERVCFDCPLPDCLEGDPACLLRREDLKRKLGEEDIHLPVGLRIVARKLGVAYETARFRVKKRQWHKLPRLFRTAPGGDWKCNPEDLDEFLRRMRGGAS